jgi:hypothetical protein
MVSVINTALTAEEVCTSMAPNLNNPKAISDAGEKIYASCYQAEYESKYPGQFVAINVMDGSATLGRSASETLEAAKREYPTGLFHLIRIGHSGAFEVGLAFKNAYTDWVFGR